MECDEFLKNLREKYVGLSGGALREFVTKSEDEYANLEHALSDFADISVVWNDSVSDSLKTVLETVGFDQLKAFPNEVIGPLNELLNPLEKSIKEYFDLFEECERCETACNKLFVGYEPIKLLYEDEEKFKKDHYDWEVRRRDKEKKEEELRDLKTKLERSKEECYELYNDINAILSKSSIATTSEGISFAGSFNQDLGNSGTQRAVLTEEEISNMSEEDYLKYALGEETYNKLISAKEITYECDGQTYLVKLKLKNAKMDENGQITFDKSFKIEKTSDGEKVEVKVKSLPFEKPIIEEPAAEVETVSENIPVEEPKQESSTGRSKLLENILAGVGALGAISDNTKTSTEDPTQEKTSEEILKPVTLSDLYDNIDGEDITYNGKTYKASTDDESSMIDLHGEDGEVLTLSKEEVAKSGNFYIKKDNSPQNASTEMPQETPKEPTQVDEEPKTSIEVPTQEKTSEETQKPVTLLDLYDNIDGEDITYNGKTYKASTDDESSMIDLHGEDGEVLTLSKEEVAKSGNFYIKKDNSPQNASIEEPETSAAANNITDIPAEQRFGNKAGKVREKNYQPNPLVTANTSKNEKDDMGQRPVVYGDLITGGTISDTQGNEYTVAFDGGRDITLVDKNGKPKTISVTELIGSEDYHVGKETYTMPNSEQRIANNYKVLDNLGEEEINQPVAANNITDIPAEQRFGNKAGKVREKNYQPNPLVTAKPAQNEVPDLRFVDQSDLNSIDNKPVYYKGERYTAVSDGTNINFYKGDDKNASMTMTAADVVLSGDFSVPVEGTPQKTPYVVPTNEQRVDHNYRALDNLGEGEISQPVAANVPEVAPKTPPVTAETNKAASTVVGLNTPETTNKTASAVAGLNIPETTNKAASTVVGLNTSEIVESKTPNSTNVIDVLNGMENGSQIKASNSSGEEFLIISHGNHYEVRDSNNNVIVNDNNAQECLSEFGLTSVNVNQAPSQQTASAQAPKTEPVTTKATTSATNTTANTNPISLESLNSYYDKMPAIATEQYKVEAMLDHIKAVTGRSNLECVLIYNRWINDPNSAGRNI